MIKGSVKKHKYWVRKNICFIELQFKDGSISAITKIDKEDLNRVLERRWSLEFSKGYVSSRLNGQTVKLHNFILNKKPLDHINQNKLDNRKSNLRETTFSQNSHNRPLFRNNTSGFKGVMKIVGNKWKASIRIRGKLYGKICTTKKQAIIQRKEWEKLI